MDDDRSDTRELTGELLNLDGDVGGHGPPTAGFETDDDLSVRERCGRALSILVTGNWRGVGYDWRDRGAVVVVGVAAVAALLSGASLAVDLAGIHPGPLPAVEAAVEVAVVRAIRRAAAALVMAVRSDWVLLLAAGFVLALLRR